MKVGADPLFSNAHLFSVKQFLMMAMIALSPCVKAASATELVLQEGAKLVAQTPSGKVTVVAGKGLSRTYEWDRCSLKANMHARTYRWFGSMGIYDPAPRFGLLDWIGDLWRSCDGIARTVVEEGQIHFEDERTAEQWIARYSKVFDTVWTNDGLVVRWGISPAREQLNVDVWQICIAGRRPARLEGAQNQALSLAGAGNTKPERYECAAVSSEITSETQKMWQEHWRQADEWNAKIRRQ